MSRKLVTRQARSRSPILAISVLLISSAVLRLGGDTGEAVAQAMTQPVKPDLPTPTANEKTDSKPKEMFNGSLDRAELGSLLGALRDREKHVAERELQIKIRQKALQVADEEVRKRLVMLEQAEANLRKTLALADGAAENDLARLTTVYENMKPKDAAALFAQMEPDFAAGFMGRMRPDAAAAVMTGLPPEIAYSISAILAGRNAKVPKS